MKIDSPLLRRLFLFENVIAALILSLPVLPEVIAYRLAMHPASETTWRALMAVDHFTINISMLRSLAHADNLSVSLVVLALACGIPLYAILSRSIFTTAMVGHTALAFGIVMLATGLGLFKLGRHVADISQWTFVGYFPVENSAMMLMFLTLLVCCAINHVVYVRLCKRDDMTKPMQIRHRLGLLAPATA